MTKPPTKGKARKVVATAIILLPHDHEQAMQQFVSLAARIARNKRIREQERAAA